MLSSLVFSACAADVGDEPSQRGSDPQQTSHAYTPPPGAHMLDADPGLSVEAALDRLHSADTQKIQPGLTCDPTPRVIEARGAGNNLVTAEWQWPEPDKGMLRASVPWGEYGGGKEGFLLCRIGSDDVLYSMGAGRYVSVELDQGVWGGDWAATLRARATYVGGWERFRISSLSQGSFAIRSMGNSRLVRGEFGYEGDGYGALRARSTSVGAWEQFGIR